MTQSITPEQLLEHVGWLRGLARRLVRDDDLAEDLVQETLLTAVERPPLKGPMLLNSSFWKSVGSTGCSDSVSASSSIAFLDRAASAGVKAVRQSAETSSHEGAAERERLLIQKPPSLDCQERA